MFRRYGVVIKLMYKTYKESIHILWKRGLTSYKLCYNPDFVHPVQDRNFVAISIKIENLN